MTTIESPPEAAIASVTPSPRARGKRVVILAAAGWPVRNFLANPGFQKFLTDNDVTFWSPAWKELAASASFKDRASFEPLHFWQPDGWRRRGLSFVSAYYGFKQGSRNILQKLELSSARARQEHLVKGLQTSAMQQLALAASHLVPVSVIERIERLLAAHAPGLLQAYEARLRENRPDLLLSTCPQINHQEWPASLAAHRLGIPTVAHVSSWDNLSSKGHFAIPFQRYLAWSQVMVGQLTRDFGVRADQIDVTGAPGFDFYFQPEFDESRADFCKRQSLDPNRPIILYAAVTPGLFPNEPHVCRIILEGIRGGLLPRQAQVLLRLHPKDPGDRWKTLSGDYPELRMCVPNSAGDLRNWTPDQGTVRDQVSCVRHGDVHVNAASTMIIDAAMLDRPVVSVAFDVVLPSFSKYIRGYYDFPHLVPVVEAGASRLVASGAELCKEISDYLKDPSRDQEGRKKVVAMQTGASDGRAALRVGLALSAMLEAGSA